MPLQWSTPTKEKKTPGGTPICHMATPTPSLRRGLVKPLGEHNKPLRSTHSPAVSVKDMKRTPKTMLPGVDLTRRFADGPAEFRSPRGSPSLLDRIREGGSSSSLGRERKGFGGAVVSKSRLRGGDDTPPVKKAITFSTPFGKDSIGKESTRRHEKVGKRKDLSERFILEVKEDMAPPLLAAMPYAAYKSPEVKSPEVCSRGFGVDWEQEWFHSRDMDCFESFSKGSKTPEAQPSKSPELSRRAMGGSPGVGARLEGTGLEVVANQQTPSPQPTSSPEFLKRGSVPPSAGGCFGAGPLMGPEGTKDRRKCKPRGILTIEGEFLLSSGSADFLDEEVQVKETISVPAFASVEWMVAEGYDVEPPGSSEKGDVEASLKFSPGSFSHLRELGERESTAVPGHRRCRSAVESGTDQVVYWKKGLLHEWNLSLSDQKRAASPSPLAEEEASVSPVGKLRDFSPEVTALDSRLSSSLVIGALGSVTNTPPSCRDASDSTGGDEVESKLNEDLPVISDIQIEHRKDDDVDHVKGVLPVEKALQELSLDGQSPLLSMSFSLDSPPDSGESWHDTHPSAWSNDSRGDWGDYLRNNRYKGFHSQFRFQSSRDEEYTPATRSVSREALSPTTFSEVYSDEGDSVVCTPSSTGTTKFEMRSCEPPYGDSCNNYCTVGNSTKCEGTLELDLERISTTTDSFSRDTSPDLVGISMSISDAPSLDSSSDDFEVLRCPPYTQGSLMHQFSEREELETSKVTRGRVLLHEADYSPSSLLKADACRGISVSGM